MRRHDVRVADSPCIVQWVLLREVRRRRRRRPLLTPLIRWMMWYRALLLVVQLINLSVLHLGQQAETAAQRAEAQMSRLAVRQSRLRCRIC